MHSREYVEDLILKSLCEQRQGDLPDSEVQKDFKLLVPILEVVMQKIIRKTRIPSFTDDDLISFMYLKTHQILRRQKWDKSRSAYSFFYVAFNNLMRDIIRRQTTIKVQEMRWDALDVVFPSEFVDQKLNCVIYSIEF